MLNTSSDINQIISRFELKFNQKVIEHIKIEAGMNNQLYKLICKDKSYLLKIYTKDKEHRLIREWSALSLLPDSGFNEVPEAVMVDKRQNWAIYTFLEGSRKTSKDLTRNDLKLIVDYVNKLQSLTPAKVKVKMHSAHMACFSIHDYLKNINKRLMEYKKTLNSPTTHPILKRFDQKYMPEKVISKTLQILLSRIPKKAISQEIATSDRRLSPVDFGPHNMLFEKDRINFLDFERFGWDDPRRLMAEFLNHDQTVDISTKDKEFAIKYYKENWNIPDSLKDNFDLIVDIFEIDWLTVIVFSITQDKINARKFANPNFDLDEYLTKQTNKMAKRIEKIDKRYKLGIIKN